MKHTLFSLEWLGEVTFEGYTQGGDWNGWALPLFPFQSAEQIVTAHREFGRSAFYDATLDAFCFVDDESDETEMFGAVDIKGRKFYAIGAGSWIWENSETEVIHS